MAAVGLDAGPRDSPETGERGSRCIMPAWRRSTSVEDRGSPGAGKRFMLHGGGRPRWRTMRGSPKSGERLTLYGGGRPRWMTTR